MLILKYKWILHKGFLQYLHFNFQIAPGIDSIAKRKNPFNILLFQSLFLLSA
jgi:hypothetical protein